MYLPWYRHAGESGRWCWWIQDELGMGQKVVQEICNKCRVLQSIIDIIVEQKLTINRKHVDWFESFSVQPETRLLSAHLSHYCIYACHVCFHRLQWFCQVHWWALILSDSQQQFVQCSSHIFTKRLSFSVLPEYICYLCNVCKYILKVCVLLGIAVIQVKVAETSRVVRHLYIKEHNVTDTHACKPNGRTLLVLNVPPYVTEVNHLLPTTFLPYYMYVGSFQITFCSNYLQCLLSIFKQSF